MVNVNARAFQEPLARLSNTMVEKVFREGVTQCGWPACVSEDIAMMLRYAMSIYDLMFYLNADERRKDDLYWHTRYGVTGMSLVRSLIDCLYNVTAILQNPAGAGPAYRRSGIKKMLKDLEEDEQRYAGREKWEVYVKERRGGVMQLIRMSGFALEDVMNQQPWATLGAYVARNQPGGILTAHQEFLRTFTYLGWRQYSALSHGAYEAFAGTLGNTPVGSYYITDFLPHDLRPKIDDGYDLFVSMHIGRAATVLLCLNTELQSYCRFDGANINERICRIWEVLLPMFEATELYEGRYRSLMAERRISQS